MVTITSTILAQLKCEYTCFYLLQMQNLIDRNFKPKPCLYKQSYIKHVCEFRTIIQTNSNWHNSLYMSLPWYYKFVYTLSKPYERQAFKAHFY